MHEIRYPELISLLAQTYDNNAQTYIDDHERESRGGHLGYPIKSGRVI